MDTSRWKPKDVFCFQGIFALAFGVVIGDNNSVCITTHNGRPEKVYRGQIPLNALTTKMDAVPNEVKLVIQGVLAAI